MGNAEIELFLLIISFHAYISPRCIIDSRLRLFNTIFIKSSNLLHYHIFVAYYFYSKHWQMGCCCSSNSADGTADEKTPLRGSSSSVASGETVQNRQNYYQTVVETVQS